MAKPKPGSRAERRALARSLDKLARDREKLAALSPGGAPERPVEVRSASQIEVHAATLPCLRCGERCRVEEHTAEVVRGARLRAVSIRCIACGASRRAWFRIVETTLS